jgi:hypothetical protein
MLLAKILDIHQYLQYNCHMKIKKIAKKIEQYATESYFKGYNTGFNDGIMESSEGSFQEGAQTEQERIQTLLDMHIQWAMESGKGNEAVMLNRVKEIITPIVITNDEDDTF